MPQPESCGDCDSYVALLWSGRLVHPQAEGEAKDRHRAFLVHLRDVHGFTVREDATGRARAVADRARRHDKAPAE